MDRSFDWYDAYWNKVQDDRGNLRNGRVKQSDEGELGGDTEGAQPMNTDITSPTHYTLGIETRQYIMSWNMDFASGNVVKYVTRAPHKGQRLSDLRKAAQYLGWLIEVATDEEQELRDASREAEYGKGPGRKEGGM